MALERWLKAAQPVRLKILDDVDQIQRTFGPAAIDILQSTIEGAGRAQEKRRLRKILRALEADQRRTCAYDDGELFI